MCDLPVQVRDRSTVSIVRWAWRRGRWSAPSTSSTSTRTLMVGGASTEHVTCIIVLTLDLAVAALCVCMCVRVCVCVVVGGQWKSQLHVSYIVSFSYKDRVAALVWTPGLLLQREFTCSHHCHHILCNIVMGQIYFVVYVLTV